MQPTAKCALLHLWRKLFRGIFVLKAFDLFVLRYDEVFCQKDQVEIAEKRDQCYTGGWHR